MVNNSDRFNDKVLNLYKKYMTEHEEEYVNFVNEHSRHSLFETIKKAMIHKQNTKKDTKPEYFSYLKKIKDSGYNDLHWLIFKTFSV